MRQSAGPLLRPSWPHNVLLLISYNAEKTSHQARVIAASPQEQLIDRRPPAYTPAEGSRANVLAPEEALFKFMQLQRGSRLIQHGGLGKPLPSSACPDTVKNLASYIRLNRTAGEVAESIPDLRSRSIHPRSSRALQ